MRRHGCGAYLWAEGGEEERQEEGGAALLPHANKQSRTNFDARTVVEAVEGLASWLSRPKRVAMLLRTFISWRGAWSLCGVLGGVGREECGTCEQIGRMQ